MSQSSIQNFLRNSGVTVVRPNTTTTTTTHRRMDPFSTPPASPRVRKVMATLATPSPLAKRRAVSLSPMVGARVRVAMPVPSTPQPARSKARIPPRPPRVVPSRSKLTFEPLRIMMATAVTEKKRTSGPDVSMARLLAKKPKKRYEPLVVAGRHYKIRVAEINGRDRQNRVTRSAKDARSVEYKVVVTDTKGRDTKGSIYVYTSGNVRYSGGVPGEDFATVHAIQRYVIYAYTPRHRFLYHPLKFSNVTGQFRGNFVLHSEAFAKFLRARQIPYTHEPETKQYFFHVGPFMVRKTGLVQMFKASSPTQLRRVYTKAKELLQTAHAHGMLAAPTGFTAKFHSPTRVQKRALPTVSTPKVTRSVNGAVCIDGKACEKLSKAQLLAYAKKLNVHVPKHVLKPTIIAGISAKSNASSSSPVKNNNDIAKHLWNTGYDQRLLRNATKRKMFKARLDADVRKIKAILDKLPKRHRSSATGEVKKTIRDTVMSEVASDTKAYVELSLEVDKYLKEPLTP